MPVRQCGVVVALAAIHAGCLGVSDGRDLAAVIAEATPASQAELRSVLEQALGPRDLLLAPDALTETSLLALEPMSGPADAAGGRLLQMPERFELVLRGSRCILVRLSTGQRYELRQTECIPAP